MFTLLRRFTSLLVPRDDRDDRRVNSMHGPLVNFLEADLASLDAVTHALSGRCPRS